MTLEEAKVSAEQGDLDSIMALGRYYFGENADENDKDIDEAIKWYEKGAEFGYENCMILTAILCSINGHAMRKVSGAYGIEDAINCLNKGLNWAYKAKELNVDDSDKQISNITGELGMSYFYYAMGNEQSKPTKQESTDRYLESINLLKSVYQTTDDPEVYIHLALSLNHYGDLNGYSEENNQLEFKLLHKCVDEYFNNVVYSDIAALNLGNMYTFGRGCETDYDKAVYYLNKANSAGLDCSELLKHFKKKLFGGYTFKS